MTIEDGPDLTVQALIGWEKDNSIVLMHILS